MTRRSSSSVQGPSRRVMVGGITFFGLVEVFVEVGVGFVGGKLGCLFAEVVSGRHAI